MPESTPQPAPTPGQPLQAPAPQQQAPQNTPPAPQLAPNTPPATPPTGTPPATPPAVVQPNAELLALKAERDQLNQNNLEAQRKITQQGQQISALVGNQVQQPPVDPLKPYVEMLTKQGYDEKDARAIAGVSHAMMQPVIQAQQQAQSAIHGTAMVNSVMQEAWTERPQLFAANPQIGQRVEQMLRHNAITGQGPVDKEFALAVAKIEWADAQFSNNQGQQQQAAPLPASFQSMYAPPPGFNAPAPVQQQKILTDAQQRATADIRAEFFPKPKSA